MNIFEKDLARKIYFKLSYPFQFIAINLQGLYLKRKRYPKRFYQILEEYMRVDKTERCNLNLRKIKAVTETTSFYNIQTKEDFNSLPIINKEYVNQNYKALYNKKFSDTFLTTGGTTGRGLKYPVSKEFIYHQWATFWKFRTIHGLNMKTWCAYLVAKPIIKNEKTEPPLWIKDYFSKRLFLSHPHLNENTIKLYLEEIKKNQVTWLHGYPSVLNLFANLVVEMNLIDLAKGLNLTCITTSSEMILDFQKVNIENVFGCKVRQLYGLTEGVVNIFECESGNLHVDESFSYVEFLQEKENSELYKIIGTQYHNKAFPLFRYNTGDYALLPEKNYECDCGRKSRVVKAILGREQDYLILSDNSKRVSIGTIIFKGTHNIYKAQIVQKKEGEAEFHIVKGPEYNETDEKILLRNIEHYLGKNFKPQFIYTDSLKTSGNGKSKLIIHEN
ncbi:MAG: hypothetical protein NTX22_05365 [Ignavibacteriales bacterium]|nr:hypothetical protein [Ignavibacteriales bacterium]